MLSRNKKEKLVLKSLDMEIFIGNLFEKCKTEGEIDWLEEQLQSMIECKADSQRDEI